MSQEFIRVRTHCVRTLTRIVNSLRMLPFVWAEQQNSGTWCVTQTLDCRMNMFGCIFSPDTFLVPLMNVSNSQVYCKIFCGPFLDLYLNRLVFAYGFKDATSCKVSFIV